MPAVEYKHVEVVHGHSPGDFFEAITPRVLGRDGLWEIISRNAAKWLAYARIQPGGGPRTIRNFRHQNCKIHLTNVLPEVDLFELHGVLC